MKNKANAIWAQNQTQMQQLQSQLLHEQQSNQALVAERNTSMTKASASASAGDGDGKGDSSAQMATLKGFLHRNPSSFLNLYMLCTSLHFSLSHTYHMNCHISNRIIVAIYLCVSYLIRSIPMRFISSHRG